MDNKIKILFLCTGNSCRSQMAEGWTRHFHNASLEVFSAGVETHGLNPKAVEVMAEAEIDISGHRSKHVNEFSGMEFDYVVTVCDHAREVCPWFPAKTAVLHQSFDDPPALAQNMGTEEEKLTIYRRVRDEIRDFTRYLPENYIHGSKQ